MNSLGTKDIYLFYEFYGTEDAVTLLTLTCILFKLKTYVLNQHKREETLDFCILILYRVMIPETENPQEA